MTAINIIILKITYKCLQSHHSKTIKLYYVHVKIHFYFLQNCRKILTRIYTPNPTLTFKNQLQKHSIGDLVILKSGLNQMQAQDEPRVWCCQTH